MSSFTKKVADGKLVRVDVELADDKISNVKITGDFFLFPENVIDFIEDYFIGLKELDYEQIKNELYFILKQHNAQLVGISIDDIIECVEHALEDQ
jgi:lipoate---protein ligase